MQTKVKERAADYSWSLSTDRNSSAFPLNIHTCISTAINSCNVVFTSEFMHQSIPTPPPPPHPGWPPGISIFFTLDGKFPGVGTLELSNPPGWGRKKRANAPFFVNTATFLPFCLFLQMPHPRDWHGGQMPRSGPGGRGGGGWAQVELTDA